MPPSMVAVTLWTLPVGAGMSDEDRADLAPAVSGLLNLVGDREITCEVRRVD